MISYRKSKLNKNTIAFESENKAGETETNLVTIGEISAKHFIVEAQPKGADFVVRAIDRKSVD